MVVERLAEEPRPHDVREYANQVLSLPLATLAWIDGWPRRAGDPWSSGGTEFYLPAPVRVDDATALAALESEATHAQADLAPTERLRQAGFPGSPPPADLPSGLSSFAGTWRGLQLGDDLPFEQLMSEVGAPFARRFAVAALRRRDRLTDEIAAWLCDPSDERRALARRAAEELRLADQPIVSALAERLADANATSREVDGIGYLINALGAPARSLAPLLRSWAQRLHRSEYYVAKHLADVAKRLDPREGHNRH
jgi:hypothetical protein